MSADSKELILEQQRDANITGSKVEKAPAKPSKFSGKCRSCIEWKLNICLVCDNFPVCNNKDNKPFCWVNEKCEVCKK